MKVPAVPLQSYNLLILTSQLLSCRRDSKGLVATVEYTPPVGPAYSRCSFIYGCKLKNGFAMNA